MPKPEKVMDWIFGALRFFFAFQTFSATIKRPALGAISAALGVLFGLLALKPDPTRLDSSTLVLSGVLSLFFLLIWLWGWYRSKNAQEGS
jgi:hypothetical protein